MTPLTRALIMFLLAWPMAANAQIKPPTTFSTKLVYPNGKPAVDALAVIDLVDSKTKAVTTVTYKPDSTGLVTITFDPAKTSAGIPVLYVKSPTAFGLFDISPLNASSTSTLQPFTSVRIRLLDSGGKPMANKHVFPSQISENNLTSNWSPWIPGPWNQTTDANGYATLTKLPQNCRLSIDVTDDTYASPDRKSTIQLAASPITPDATVQLYPAATLSGTAHFISNGDSANKPIAGMKIEARSDSQIMHFGLTDQTGAYTITRLGPGTYNLIAMDPHKVASPWLGKPQTIRIDTGVSQSDIDITMIHGGLITGKITDKTTGKPIPNIDVVSPMPGGTYYPGDTTNADGVFSFHVLPGAHELYVTIPYVGGELATPQHIDIADEETKTIDFQIDTPILRAAVYGTVLNPQDKPVPGAEVNAVDKRCGIITVKTNSTGRFTFDSPGLLPNDTILARSGALATSDAYTYSGQKDITLRLTPGALCSLTGQVTDKSGAPVPNAPVHLLVKLGDTLFTLGQTATDTHGRYTFPQAYDNATFMISTVPSGYAQGDSTYIPITKAQTIQVPAIILTVTDSFLGGTLLDAKGNAVPHATICDNWRTNVNTQTDQSGHFMLKGLPAKRVVLTIRTDDNRTDFAEVDTGHDGVTLYMPSPVNGVVLGPDNNPVAGATISAQVNDRGAQTFTTDEFGHFSINAPGLKRNSALMAHSRNLGTAVPVFYKGDDLTLRLTPGNLCSISGQVVNADGTPAPNIAVSLIGFSPILNGIIENTQTNANGHYTFDPIYANTKYCVEPSATGYSHSNSDEFNTYANQPVQVPTLKIVPTDAFAGGTVVDAKGQPVPNVNVTDQDTGIGATTDQSGHFMLKGVPRDKTYVSAMSPQNTYGDQTITSNRGDNIIYLSKPKP